MGEERAGGPEDARKPGLSRVQSSCHASLEVGPLAVDREERAAGYDASVGMYVCPCCSLREPANWLPPETRIRPDVLHGIGADVDAGNSDSERADDGVQCSSKASSEAGMG